MNGANEIWKRTLAQVTQSSFSPEQEAAISIENRQDCFARYGYRSTNTKRRSVTIFLITIVTATSPVTRHSSHTVTGVNGTNRRLGNQSGPVERSRVNIGTPERSSRACVY